MVKKQVHRHKDYFQGILQLRNLENKDFEKAADFVRNTAEKNKNPLAGIAKEEGVRNGLDFYLTDNKYLVTLAKKVQNYFGGEMKTASKLFTRNKQTSKAVYRLNVLVRLPDFGVDDVLKIKNKLILVKRAKAKTVQGIDLMKNKRTSAPYKEYDIVARSEDIKAVYIDKKYPRMEVLHPETYQSVPVENPKETKKEQIKVVIINRKVYMV